MVDAAARVRRLPSFFIIGPPRTGTTWLHGVLSQRAWLSHPTKETRFFDKHFHRGLDWYQSHYRKASEARPIGEVAPTYFASSEARERIAQTVPAAKVVCTFRNPVDRVLSLYRLKRALGLIPWNFEEALVRDPELLESSRYSAHLQAWQSTLGRSQVMVTVYDDMRADPQAYLDTVMDFVGMPRLKLADSQRRPAATSEWLTQPRSYYVTRGALWLAEWSKAKRLDSIVAALKRLGAERFFMTGGSAFPELSLSQRDKLREFFRPEIGQLERMLNRDFSAWK
jgi:sulfotransferase family protein